MLLIPSLVGAWAWLRPLLTAATLADIVCTVFALWTVPALLRVITSSDRLEQRDPFKVVALLLISSRYGFTLSRWAFGMHREFITHAEELARDGAFWWQILTVAAAAYVIRAYRTVQR
jgi:hypothetical protein